MSRVRAETDWEVECLLEPNKQVELKGYDVDLMRLEVWKNDRRKKESQKIKGNKPKVG